MRKDFIKLYKGVSGVYKITNKLSGEFYIGASSNVGVRWLQHMASKYLDIQNDIQDLGVDNFAFEVVEEVSREKLPEREQYWITKLNPSYNISVGRGCPGFTYKHTEEAKRKMSKAKEGWKGNETTWRKGHEPWNKGKECPWRGRPRSEEVRKRISEGHRKALENPEYRKRSSEAQKIKYRWLFPDGSIRLLNKSHASRFINKGIELKNLGLCE